jgi:hypothetical protein
VIDAVVTHHTNPFRSGVARFNALLAERLGVPVVALPEAGGLRAPLLSFKVSELGEPERAAVGAALPAWRAWLFLHEFCGAELERRLVGAAERVLAGNREVAAKVAPLHPRVETLWTPGLILEERRIAPAEVRVFSFGMAHKIRTAQFARLRELLNASGRSYAVHVSAANHETATQGDAEAVFHEMAEIFGDRVHFLGTLSDLAVVHELRRATFFAAFFPGGVRANNTTVASAMERGAVVVTNLDDGSPEGLRHLENVVDIGQAQELPFDPLVLREVSAAAMRYARARSWEALVARVRNGDGRGPG